MTLDPYLAAPFEIQIHALAALIALVVGPFALWRKRRDRLHKVLGYVWKVLGYVWVVTMGIAALTAFLISSEFSPIGVGPIHVLAVYALYGIYVAMKAIFRRDVKLHKQVMENIYVRGLALAGAFNFLPGRTSQRSVFPDFPEVGYVIIAAVLIWAFVPLISRRRNQQPARAKTRGATV